MAATTISVGAASGDDRVGVEPLAAGGLNVGTFQQCGDQPERAAASAHKAVTSCRPTRRGAAGSINNPGGQIEPMLRPPYRGSSLVTAAAGMARASRPTRPDSRPRCAAARCVRIGGPRHAAALQQRHRSATSLVSSPISGAPPP